MVCRWGLSFYTLNNEGQVTWFNMPTLHSDKRNVQSIRRIEFEAYFPPQLNIENAKSSLDVEGPHHYNIFF